MSETWYRYEDRLVSYGWDEFTERSQGHYVEVTLLEFCVLKHTPKGVWLSPYPHCATPNHDNARFVLNQSRKRYACATKEAARESYVARKQKQIRIYKARIQDAEDGLRALERLP